MATTNGLRLMVWGLVPAMLIRAAAGQVDLSAGFRDPPREARPHTWWHWMNGNITLEGITADLEAMKRIGLGGAQIFNVSESIPDGPVKIMSQEWLDLLAFAGIVWLGITLLTRFFSLVVG